MPTEEKTVSINILSPEELLAEIYNRKVPESWGVHQDGVQQGIRYVAAAYGLKIKGVNCE